VTDVENRMDGKWILGFMPYGELWRKERKLMHTYMHAGAVPTFHPVQITAAHRLVIDLLAAPQHSSTLPSVVQCNIGQTIIKIVYGIDVKDADSDLASIPGQFARLLTESLMPGRFLVDLIPACEFWDMFGCLLVYFGNILC
jgi:cytochrome P450